jgi:hypothetical protein
MTIMKAASRPPWVRDAIFELMAEASAIEGHRVRLADIAMKMKMNGADTSELVDAAHEIDHAWRHLTAARRALVMTWPSFQPEDDQ